jgi:hypothetical protein
VIDQAASSQQHLAPRFSSVFNEIWRQERLEAVAEGFPRSPKMFSGFIWRPFMPPSTLLLSFLFCHTNLLIHQRISSRLYTLALLAWARQPEWEGSPQRALTHRKPVSKAKCGLGS